MIRIAAAGDVHFDRTSRGKLSRHWHELVGKADLFVLAGDLTQVGHPEEALPLAEDLAECPVPVFAVLGNHDYHMDQEDEIKAINATLADPKFYARDPAGFAAKSKALMDAEAKLAAAEYSEGEFGGKVVHGCCLSKGKNLIGAHSSPPGGNLRLAGNFSGGKTVN